MSVEGTITVGGAGSIVEIKKKRLEESKLRLESENISVVLKII